MSSTGCKCIGHMVQVVDWIWVVDYPDPDCEAKHFEDGQLKRVD